MAEESLSAAELKALIKESVAEIESDRKAAEEAARQAEEAARQAAAHAPDQREGSAPGEGTDGGPADGGTAHIDVQQALPPKPEYRNVPYRSHGRIRVRREPVNNA